MKIKHISSQKNESIKWLNKLQTKSRFRRSENLYVVEGFKQVLELDIQRIHTLAVESESVMESYVDRFVERHGDTGSDVRDMDVLVLGEKLFRSVSTDMNPQGILAVVSMNTSDLLSETIDGEGCYLALDGIQDPGNLGTMIRVSDAVGSKGIILNKSCVDPYNPKVVKSTMGSLEHIQLYLVDDLVEGLEFLHDAGIESYGAYLDHSRFHFDYTYPKGVCFVIGNEGNGISDAVIAIVKHRVKIPMPGQSESLNASIAASVLLYENLRQQLKGTALD